MLSITLSCMCTALKGELLPTFNYRKELKEWEMQYWCFSSVIYRNLSRKRKTSQTKFSSTSQMKLYMLEIEHIARLTLFNSSPRFWNMKKFSHTNFRFIMVHFERKLSKNSRLKNMWKCAEIFNEFWRKIGWNYVENLFFHFKSFEVGKN